VPQFKTKLQAAPFHLQLVEKLDTNLLPFAGQSLPIVTQPGNGVPSWLNHFPKSLTITPDKPKPVVEDHFSIEGVMR
jgi:hypothetical protein